MQCAIKWRQPSIGAVLALTSNHTLPQLVLLLSSSHFQLNLMHCEGKSKRFHTVCILICVCILYFFLQKDQDSALTFESITARKQICVFVFVFVFVFVAFCISLARWAAHPGVWGQLLQESRAGKPRVGFD